MVFTSCMAPMMTMMEVAMAEFDADAGPRDRQVVSYWEDGLLRRFRLAMIHADDSTVSSALREAALMYVERYGSSDDAQASLRAGRARRRRRAGGRRARARSPERKGRAEAMAEADRLAPVVRFDGAGRPVQGLQEHAAPDPGTVPAEAPAQAGRSGRDRGPAPPADPGSDAGGSVADDIMRQLAAPASGPFGGGIDAGSILDGA